MNLNDENEYFYSSKPIHMFHTCCVFIIMKVVLYCIKEKILGRLQIGTSFDRPYERASAMLGISVRVLYNIRNKTIKRLLPLGSPRLG